MSETNTDAQEPEKEMSPEEYHKLRVAAQKELREEIKFLKTEYEYQDLLTKIEEAKARRLRAIAIQYEMKNPSPQQAQGPQKPQGDYDHPVAAPMPFAAKEEGPKVRKLQED